MIVDCHTRIWNSPDQLGPHGGAWLTRNGGLANLTADTGEHLAAARPAQRSLVWGFRSSLAGADIPNAFLADYIAQHPAEMIAIAAVDPAEPDALERLANIQRRTEFGGITLCPAAQGVHPADSRVLPIYQFCAEYGLPVFIENAADFAPQGVLEFARPMLYDEIARLFPDLTILIAGLGWPWVGECAALLAKQPRVFADFAELLRRPWDAWHALLIAHQFGVARKLVFGSDFPFATAAGALERTYRVNEIIHGTSLPVIPREVLRGIVEGDAIKELALRV